VSPFAIIPGRPFEADVWARSMGEVGSCGIEEGDGARNGVFLDIESSFVAER
jgi:hypothetical protein